MIDRYIHFYNHERIQNETGVAPLTLRHLRLKLNISYIGPFVLSVQTGVVQPGIYCFRGGTARAPSRAFQTERDMV